VVDLRITPALVEDLRITSPRGRPQNNGKTSFSYLNLLLLEVRPNQGQTFTDQQLRASRQSQSLNIRVCWMRKDMIRAGRRTRDLCIWVGTGEPLAELSSRIEKQYIESTTQQPISGEEYLSTTQVLQITP